MRVNQKEPVIRLEHLLDSLYVFKIFLCVIVIITEALKEVSKLLFEVGREIGRAVILRNHKIVL